MNRTLKSRLERLERRKFRHPLPRIVLAIYERTDDEIIGYRVNKLVAMRTQGEPLGELQARAWALEGSTMLVTLYRQES